MKTNRRQFVRNASALVTGAVVLPGLGLGFARHAYPGINEADMFFKISLAEWSLHKALFAKKMDHLDFAAKARSMGIGGIEYVNQFFKDKAEDTSYLDQMNQRAADHNVKQLIIMVDGEGGLGDPDSDARKEAVQNHHKWVHAAKYLGCHSIRVNAYGEGSREEVWEAAVDGLGSLARYAAKEDIAVIVENHGGFSSDGKWLSGVMSEIDMPNCGTLPDFGNFCIKRDRNKPWGQNCVEEYDKYLGIKELMPFAHAVSAKSYRFDEDGNEPDIDFHRIMKIVKAHGYTGYVGIEYEGSELSEEEGIMATKRLLEKVGKQLKEG